MLPAPYPEISRFSFKSRRSDRFSIFPPLPGPSPPGHPSKSWHDFNHGLQILGSRTEARKFYLPLPVLHCSWAMANPGLPRRGHRSLSVHARQICGWPTESAPGLPGTWRKQSFRERLGPAGCLLYREIHEGALRAGGDIQDFPVGLCHFFNFAKMPFACPEDCHVPPIILQFSTFDIQNPGQGGKGILYLVQQGAARSVARLSCPIT